MTSQPTSETTSQLAFASLPAWFFSQAVVQRALCFSAPVCVVSERGSEQRRVLGGCWAESADEKVAWQRLPQPRERPLRPLLRRLSRRRFLLRSGVPFRLPAA